MSEHRDSWFDNRSNTDRIVRGVYVAAAIAFLSDLFYHKHPHVPVEEWFGFYAIFGLIVSIALVLVAREFRKLVMRPEDYYSRDDRLEGEGNDE